MLDTCRDVGAILRRRLSGTVTSGDSVERFALPLRQRTALVLRYYSDLSVQETADVMGCAPGTVKSLTSQALAALRQTAGLVDHSPLHAALEEPSHA